MPVQAVDEGPYIPASQSLPEITLKGVVLGLFLAVLLGAANTYLGLKAGLTVAASIPAAVLSLGVLRLFRNSNILENNMVQTIASAGTSVASGALFTIPALLILGKWDTVHYWEVTLIAITGGLLGVLFTVPIRRALIIEEKLPFPEGLATGEVLKAGATGGAGVGALLLGGLAGAGYKGLQSIAGLWHEGVSATVAFGNRSVLGMGITMSAALMGVGVIVGLSIAILVFAGGVIGWFVGIPLYSLLADDVYNSVTLDDGTVVPALVDSAAASMQDLPTHIWSRRIRYMGVGAMLVGGIWSLVKLRKPLTRAVMQGIRATKKGQAGSQEIPRTEREFPFLGVGLGILVLAIPMFLYYNFFLGGQAAIAGALVAIMLVTGFLFSAVGAYMAGLVGSSNTPISGVTILTLLAAAFTLLAFGIEAPIGPAAAIVVAAVICVAGSIAGDNLQDLKAGHMLGATPWKQQLMLMVGAVASAFFLAPIMQTLINGAVKASKLPVHEAIGSPSLPAPQSGLMAAVSDAIFPQIGKAGLPLHMVAIGAGIAVVLILINTLLENSKVSFRTPVMPVAVGIYLPVGLSIPILIGGLAAFFAERFYTRRSRQEATKEGAKRWNLLGELGNRTGILFASGLIAGEAILGILGSVFIVAEIQTNAIPGAVAEHTWWAGLVLLGYLVFLAYYVSIRPGLKAKEQP